MIWKDVQREVYSEKVLEPVSDHIIITDNVTKIIQGLTHDRILGFNKKIDDLSRYIDGGRRDGFRLIRII